MATAMYSNTYSEIFLFAGSFSRLPKCQRLFWPIEGRGSQMRLSETGNGKRKKNVK